MPNYFSMSIIFYNFIPSIKNNYLTPKKLKKMRTKKFTSKQQWILDKSTKQIEEAINGQRPTENFYTQWLFMLKNTDPEVAYRIAEYFYDECPFMDKDFLDEIEKCFRYENRNINFNTLKNKKL